VELLPGLAIVLFSLTVHEFAHGWMASRCGDGTARSLGRVTLNPLPHIDPLGTVLLPLVLHLLGMPLFGWAKPTPVVVSRLRRPRWDSVKVAAAGPAVNLAVAAAASALLRWAPWGAVAPGWAVLLREFLTYAAYFNVLLAVFNLLPIPPLDGGRVMGGFVPPRLAARFRRYAAWGPALIAALFLTNLFPKILWPFVTGVAAALGLHG
jgi:Zn-dependent protease